MKLLLFYLSILLVFTVNCFSQNQASQKIFIAAATVSDSVIQYIPTHKDSIEAVYRSAHKKPFVMQLSATEDIVSLPIVQDTLKYKQRKPLNRLKTSASDGLSLLDTADKSKPKK